MEFNNKNVIVTGGAAGIGKAVVEGVVRGGGHAIIVDINKQAALAVQNELGNEYVSVYKTDLSKPDEIRKVFHTIIEEKTQIHSLINNAGIVNSKPFEEISQEEWDRIIAINLTGVYTALSVIYPHMKEKQYGRIVNVASVAAKRGGGFLGTSAYAASKAGVIGLTKAIAREGGPYKIACNAVCPAFTKTAMLDNMSDEIREKVTNSMPLGRGAEPQEIANVILFLASDLASFVTGEITDADGGVTMDG